MSDDAKEFIQTLIDGINIMDDDMKNIDEYINDDFELGFFITHDELTTRGIFSRVMSWYIEYKLKIMGITVISELSNDIAQGYQTFTTLLSKKYKLYIVHPSKRHSYDTDKRPMPAGDHIKSEQVSLIRSPNGTYSDSICIDSTTATHMKDQSKEIHKTTDYIVTEYDPKDRKDTLNDYMYFVKDVYENVFDIIFQDNVSRYSEFNSDTRIDTGGALFIYGQVVTTLPRALAVLCLFANNLLTGVKSTITLRIPDSLRDVAIKYIKNRNAKANLAHLNEHGAKQLLDRLVKGGKKRSSKKTYKARIKSNNRNKNRSRRSRTKYNKNTARRHNNSGTIFYEKLTFLVAERFFYEKLTFLVAERFFYEKLTFLVAERFFYEKLTFLVAERFFYEKLTFLVAERFFYEKLTFLVAERFFYEKLTFLVAERFFYEKLKCFIYNEIFQS